MLLFLLFGVLSSKGATEDYVALSEGINRITHCVGKPQTVSIYPPFSSRVVLAFNQLPASSIITVASPPTSKGIRLNMSNPSVLLPTGDAVIKVQMKEPGCVGLAHASLPGVACYNGIQVITEDVNNYKISNEQRASDTCLFFAGASGLEYKSERCNLDEDSVKVYREAVNNRWYDMFTGRREPVFSSLSARPWLFRLETTKQPLITSSFNGLELTVTGRSYSDNALRYTSTPYFVLAPKIKSSTNRWYIPVLGSIAPIILACSLIYTVKMLTQKSTPLLQTM